MSAEVFVSVAAGGRHGLRPGNDDDQSGRLDLRLRVGCVDQHLRGPPLCLHRDWPPARGEPVAERIHHCFNHRKFLHSFWLNEWMHRCSNHRESYNLFDILWQRACSFSISTRRNSWMNESIIALIVVSSYVLFAFFGIKMGSFSFLLVEMIWILGGLIAGAVHRSGDSFRPRREELCYHDVQWRSILYLCAATNNFQCRVGFLVKRSDLLRLQLRPSWIFLIGIGLVPLITLNKLRNQPTNTLMDFVMEFVR